MQCLNMMWQSHDFTLFLFCFLYCGLFYNTVNISDHKGLQKMTNWKLKKVLIP